MHFRYSVLILPLIFFFLIINLVAASSPYEGKKVADISFTCRDIIQGIDPSGFESHVSNPVKNR